MISVRNVSKDYYTRSGKRTVLHDITFDLKKGEKIGILGRNGAGKSTLIRLLSGVEPPTSGTIDRKMSISWPLAFSGAFQGSLTGMDNLRFISRIYGADFDYIKQFTEEFSELGEYLYEPVRKYSSGMRARLAFALSLSVEFDCYLIDEVIAVGDSRFAAKCKHELFEKRKDRSLILVSHSLSSIKEYCDSALVLEDGIMHQFSSIDDAYKFYNKEQIVDFSSDGNSLKQQLIGKTFLFSRYNGSYPRTILLEADGAVTTLAGTSHYNESFWDVRNGQFVFKNDKGEISGTFFAMQQKPNGFEGFGYSEVNRTIIFKLVEQK